MHEHAVRVARDADCEGSGVCDCRDELRAAWAAFTPLLHAIDRGEAEPLKYPAGSRGPPASDVLVSKAGFVKNANYLWKAKNSGQAGDIS